jgi:hypothetical protein
MLGRFAPHRLYRARARHRKTADILAELEFRSEIVNTRSDDLSNAAA